MRRVFIKSIVIIGCMLVFLSATEKKTTSYKLENRFVTLSVDIKDGILNGEKIVFNKDYNSKYNSSAIYESDGGFKIECVWTDWRAPGKNNNGEVELTLDKNAFELQHKNEISDPKYRALELFFFDKEKELNVKITYKLDNDNYYVRRKIMVFDTLYQKHFLHSISAYDSKIKGSFSVIKTGSFGQPIALKYKNGGVFMGMEYPTAVNEIKKIDKEYTFTSNQIYGKKIEKQGIETEWVVVGLVPSTSVKDWFMKYVADIRVAPINPYTLYNSWYDLRSPEYPRVPAENFMNEKSVFKMIDLFKKNMIEKHKIQLDAFVLDDGWDIYDSDWKLRTDQFPNGMKPIADELKKMNTKLGIWFGPTGGYSFRERRLKWMQNNGYEVAGKEVKWHSAMLCMGGKNYNDIFKKRTKDFVENDDVRYFKWDGIQFSCSEPNHGHNVGIYSRRDIMESVIDAAQNVRKNHPDMYLNITSGTWLSPWWVKYANQIWMDGEDYGYADVPSISKRDAAITYRDFVLYDDFKNKDLWFPISNLMTHGIIKGKLEMLGTASEPLSKFTDDVFLYFARGVSMYELYISPDIMTDDEWDVMSKSIKWAKANFDILKNTYMIGGNPMKRESYGYIHFAGKKGILAVRNPYITNSKITAELLSDYGIDLDAKNLVVERIYPTRTILSKLYKTGDKIDISLQGYETAVYEIYPIETAKEPIISGVVFEKTGNEINILKEINEVKVLNPGGYKFFINEKEVKGNLLSKQNLKQPEFLSASQIKQNENKFSIMIQKNESVEKGELAILLKPEEISKEAKLPTVKVLVNGKEVLAELQKQEKTWCWYSVELTDNTNNIELEFLNNKDVKNWAGKGEIYFSGQQKQNVYKIKYEGGEKMNERILPPAPFKSLELKNTLKIHDFNIKIER